MHCKVEKYLFDLPKLFISLRTYFRSQFCLQFDASVAELDPTKYKNSTIKSYYNKCRTTGIRINLYHKTIFLTSPESLSHVWNCHSSLEWNSSLESSCLRLSLNIFFCRVTSNCIKNSRICPCLKIWSKHCFLPCQIEIEWFKWPFFKTHKRSGTSVVADHT